MSSVETRCTGSVSQTSQRPGSTRAPSPRRVCHNAKWPTRAQAELLDLLKAGWRIVEPPSTAPFAIPPMSFRRKAKRARIDTLITMHGRKWLRRRNLMDNYHEYRLTKRGRHVLQRYEERLAEEGPGRWNRAGPR